MQMLNQRTRRAGLNAHEQFLRDRRAELIQLLKLRAELVAEFPTATDKIRKLDAMISDVRQTLKEVTR